MNREDYYLRHADITVHLTELRVWVGAQEIHPTLAEMRLLLILLEEPYRMVLIEELVKRMDLTGDKSLWTVMCRLRKLLGRKYIVTHWQQRGYSFDRIPWEKWHQMKGEQHELQAR